MATYTGIKEILKEYTERIRQWVGEEGAKNLLPYPYFSFSSYVNEGVTYSFDEDSGWITATGGPATGTGARYHLCNTTYKNTILLKKGSYKIHAEVTDLNGVDISSTNTVTRLWIGLSDTANGATSQAYNNYGGIVSFSITEDKWMSAIVHTDVSESPSLKIRVWLCKEENDSNSYLLPSLSNTALSKYSKFVMPINSVYVQFPNQATPAKLFGGTWTEINYLGAFFRARNGYSYGFAPSCTLTGSSTATTYTFSGDISSNIKIGCILFCTSNNKTVRVTNVDTITDSQGVVTKTEITVNSTIGLTNPNVIYSQPEGIPNIKAFCTPQRSNNGWYATGSFYESSEQTNAKRDAGSGGSTNGIGFDASLSSSVYGASSHVTPENFSVIIWKRTA